jgi:hypothetical protein
MFVGDIQLEEVARALLLTLKNDLPTHLGEVADEMQAADVQYYTAELGLPVPETPLPGPLQYLEGHYPSILDWDVSAFPVLTAMAYEHSLDPAGLDADQVEPMGSATYVELFASDTDEGTLSRRSWRYAKALHRCVARNPTLGGVVEPITTTPDVFVSNAVTRRVSEFTDEVIYIQAARLEYTFRTPQPW